MPLRAIIRGMARKHITSISSAKRCQSSELQRTTNVFESNAIYVRRRKVGIDRSLHGPDHNQAIVDMLRHSKESAWSSLEITYDPICEASARSTHYRVLSTHLTSLRGVARSLRVIVDAGQ